jgi:probable F420-dependent oxidoreductase
MEFGYLSLNDASGIRPDDLARELEARGFDSIWMPEHSHIPTSRQTAYPGGGDLPEGYWRMMDPFVSLTLAAGASDRLQLYTGICLVLEHDLLDLACTTATLDALSGGRLHLGIGVGWNEEELVNHRPDLPFKKRYSAMEERVTALRTIWSEERPSFEGTWDRFTESWVYPKPADGTIPIVMGNAGPLGIDHAARYGDEWCPIDGSLLNDGRKPDVAGGIELFKTTAAEAGRDPDTIPISLFLLAPRPDRVERYADLGVDRVVVMPPTMALHSADDTLRHLDSVADLVEAHA